VLLQFTVFVLDMFLMATQVENKLIGCKPGTVHPRSASADRKRRSFSPPGSGH